MSIWDALQKRLSAQAQAQPYSGDPLKIKALIEAVRAAVTIPFTVKIRSGWDSKSTNYLEIGRIAEECGVDAITLHSRTTAQGFGGRSDWSHIAELKKALKIPVIGNGDIKTPEDAKRMLDETSCDWIMIGRGALGNPWIFSRTLKYLEEGVIEKPPSEKEIHSTIKRHIEMLADYLGDKWAVREFRKHISWYTKGLSHSADFRKSAIHIDNMEDLLDETEAYFETLESIDDDFFTMHSGPRIMKSALNKERLYENLLASIEDGVVVLAPDNVILTFNQGAEGVIGVSEGMAVGNNLSSIIGEQEVGSLAQKAYETGKSFSDNDLSIRKKTGALSLSPLLLLPF